MKREAWLGELMQMANEGKKFKAWPPNNPDIPVALNQHLFSSKSRFFSECHYENLAKKWTYEEIREPEVLEFDLFSNDYGFFEWHQPEAIIKLYGKKWRIVATEILEE